MTFFAILCALLLEQARPIPRYNPVHAAVRAWAGWASRNLDAGKPQHAGVTWLIAVGLPAAAALGVHWLLDALLGSPFALLWDIAVLYATLGFRQFSRHFTGIRDALDRGDEAQARELVAHWQQVETRDLPRAELVRHVIEYSVLAAHRHVFGVLAWYVVPSALGLGPAGAVLYRLSEFVARYWQRRGGAGTGATQQRASAALRRVAKHCWHAIDWLPARLTAWSFAVVGSFEEAIDGWRNHARQFPDDNDGVVLAATAGAINVRLGGAALPTAFAASAAQPLEYESGSIPTPGRESEPAHLRIVIRLVWRSVVMWVVLLALLTLARLLG